MSVPGFRESCGEFVYDLRKFGDEASRTRLEATRHRFYLGLPYFDKDTAKKLLKLPTMRGTLKDDLRALAQKREGCTECIALGLPPIFECLLKVQWDKESKEARVEELQSGGLSFPAKEKSGGLSSFAKEMAKKGAGILKETFGGKSGEK